MSIFLCAENTRGQPRTRELLGVGGDAMAVFGPDEHYFAAYMIRGFLIFGGTLLVPNNTPRSPPSSKGSWLLS